MKRYASMRKILRSIRNSGKFNSAPAHLRFGGKEENRFLLGKMVESEE